MNNEQEFVSFLLRCILMSGDFYGDDNNDSTYPAPGSDTQPGARIDEQLQYLNFVLAHQSRFYRALSLFQDADSRALFLSLILFRILGYRRIRMPIAIDAYRASQANAKAVPGTPSAISPPGADLNLRHFELIHEGTVLRLDCLTANLRFSFFLKQYYFERAGCRVQPERGDSVIDAGGCFGDTALAFSQSVGPDGHVYSFEPLDSNIEVFKHNLAQNPGIRNITLIASGLAEWERVGPPPPGPPNPGFSLLHADTDVPLQSLDALVRDGTIAHVDLIKMDVEGYELFALRGARETLFRFRPKLAISIYHEWSDYFRIPEFIASLGLGYKMYLENYTISDGETIMYAICENREPRL